MVLSAAIALAASMPPAARAEHASATAQATATVRIISAVRLHLDGLDNGSDIPPARETVFTSGGVQQPARLIEFQ
jgi:hypothetical protein